jgi:hypothetical protein
MALNAVLGDDHDLAIIDLAHELRPDDIKRAGFRRKHICVLQLAEHQRAQAQRIACANQLLVGNRDQRVAAFNLQERVNEPFDETLFAAARHQMHDHLGIRGGLANRAGGDQFSADLERVRDISVVCEGEAASRKVSEQWLNIAQSCLACRGIT